MNWHWTTYPNNYKKFTVYDSKGKLGNENVCTVNDVHDDQLKNISTEEATRKVKIICAAPKMLGLLKKVKQELYYNDGMVEQHTWSSIEDLLDKLE